MRLIVALAFAIALAVPAFAEQDITARLNSTTIAATSTNSTAQTQPLGWGRNDIMTIQATVTGTNAASGTLKLTWETSLDTAYWQSAVHTTALTTGSGTTTTLTSITNSDGSRWLRIKGMANTNAAGGGTITINKLVVHNN